MRMSSPLGVPKLNSVADKLLRVFITNDSVYNILMTIYGVTGDSKTAVSTGRDWIAMYTGESV